VFEAEEHAATSVAVRSAMMNCLRRIGVASPRTLTPQVQVPNGTLMPRSALAWASGRWNGSGATNVRMS
jgi:hypothetical protein